MPSICSQFMVTAVFLLLAFGATSGNPYSSNNDNSNGPQEVKNASAADVHLDDDGNSTVSSAQLDMNMVNSSNSSSGNGTQNGTLDQNGNKKKRNDAPGIFRDADTCHLHCRVECQESLYFPAGRKNGEIYELQFYGGSYYYCDKLPKMIHAYMASDSCVVECTGSSGFIGFIAKYSTAIVIFSGLAFGLAVGSIIGLIIACCCERYKFGCLNGSSHEDDNGTAHGIVHYKKNNVKDVGNGGGQSVHPME